MYDLAEESCLAGFGGLIDHFKAYLSNCPRYAMRKYGFFKYRALCAQLGLTMTPHMARHSMATWLVQDGVNTATIMEAGGWKDVKSVLRYGRANLAEVRAARGHLPALGGGRPSNG